MNNLIIVYITNPSMQAARKVAQYLLEKKLIACANIMQAESMHWWKGAIVQEDEAILIAKTIADMYEQIKKDVTKIHEYSVPCIVQIPIKANQSYTDFVHHEVIKK